MGYFDRDTVTLPLPSDPSNAGAEPSTDGTRPPGAWVEIKGELDFGDVNFRSRKIVRLTSKGLAGGLADADAAWEIDQFSQATLERAIVGWNLTQRNNGKEVELKITPQTIAMLNNRDATFIMAEVMRRNAGATEDEAGKAGEPEDTTSSSKESPAASTPTLPD